jgi:hypothetical protein
VVVVGEPLFVEVEVVNPLAIAVELQELQLFAELTPKEPAPEGAMAVSRLHRLANDNVPRRESYY